MALPAFLVPALTSFALAKLTGASTKNALKGAIIGGITGGIADKLTAPSVAEMATKESVMAQLKNAPVGTSQLPAPTGAVTSGIASAKEALGMGMLRFLCSRPMDSKSPPRKGKKV